MRLTKLVNHNHTQGPVMTRAIELADDELKQLFKSNVLTSFQNNLRAYASRDGDNAAQSPTQIRKTALLFYKSHCPVCSPLQNKSRKSASSLLLVTDDRAPFPRPAASKPSGVSVNATECEPRVL